MKLTSSFKFVEQVSHYKILCQLFREMTRTLALSKASREIQISVASADEAASSPNFTASEADEHKHDVVEERNRDLI
jgi:hypothetical protein